VIALKVESVEGGITGFLGGTGTGLGGTGTGLGGAGGGAQYLA